MARLHRLTFGLLLIVTLGLAFTSASARRGVLFNRLDIEEGTRFQESLNSVDATSLHNVLHDHMADKYQDGVFEEDKKAMEAVHRSNSAVAHSLLELAKRQTNSTAISSAAASTSPADTPSTSAAVTPTASIAPTTATSVAPTSTTPPETQSQSQSTVQSQSQTQAQSQPAQTSAQSTQQTSAQSTNQPTIAAQSTSTSPSAVMSTTSSSPPQSSTNDVASTGKSTTPSTTSDSKQSSSTSRASITQQTIYTTTLADGAVSTVTSITVVPAQAESTTKGTKTGGNASLQTNNANSKSLGLGVGSVLGMVGLVVMGAL